MSAPKFTPWRVGYDINAVHGGVFSIVDSRGMRVASAAVRYDRSQQPMDALETVAQYAARASDNVERAANARLIAAAPDLYEALADLVVELENCGRSHHPDPDGELLAMARAALAKVK